MLQMNALRTTSTGTLMVLQHLSVKQFKSTAASKFQFVEQQAKTELLFCEIRLTAHELHISVHEKAIQFMLLATIYGETNSRQRSCQIIQKLPASIM